MNIDPNPEAMRLFRVERPRDINLQSGVSDQRGELDYFIFDDPALNTFDRALAEDRTEKTAYRMVGCTKISVDRLDALLDRYWPKDWTIDFMSVDAEGFDLKVLRSNNWDKYRPNYVLAECLGVSLDSMESEPVHMLLASNGYKIFAKTVNTFFYRNVLDKVVR
jgi:hypothetical protein